MTTLKDYPYWPAETIKDLKEQMREITHTRKDDIALVNNLPNIFISGRKVGKIPSSSADIVPTDRLGDFNYDADYLYIVVDNSGAEWRRASLGSW